MPKVQKTWDNVVQNWHDMPRQSGTKCAWCKRRSTYIWTFVYSVSKLFVFFSMFLLFFVISCLLNYYLFSLFLGWKYLDKNIKIIFWVERWNIELLSIKLYYRESILKVSISYNMYYSVPQFCQLKLNFKFKRMTRISPKGLFVWKDSTFNERTNIRFVWPKTKSHNIRPLLTPRSLWPTILAYLTINCTVYLWLRFSLNFAILTMICRPSVSNRPIHYIWPYITFGLLFTDNALFGFSNFWPYLFYLVRTITFVTFFSLFEVFH